MVANATILVAVLSPACNLDPIDQKHRTESLICYAAAFNAKHHVDTCTLKREFVAFHRCALYTGLFFSSLGCLQVRLRSDALFASPRYILFSHPFIILPSAERDGARGRYGLWIPSLELEKKELRMDNKVHTHMHTQCYVVHDQCYVVCTQNAMWCTHTQTQCYLVHTHAHTMLCGSHTRTHNAMWCTIKAMLCAHTIYIYVYVCTIYIYMVHTLCYVVHTYMHTQCYVVHTHMHTQCYVVCMHTHKHTMLCGVHTQCYLVCTHNAIWCTHNAMWCTGACTNNNMWCTHTSTHTMLCGAHTMTR